MKWIFAMLITACAAPEKDTGQGPLGHPVTLTDFQYRACWEDVSGAESVTTRQLGAGAISVEHEVWLEDCTVPCASAFVDEDRLRVVYDYTNQGTCETTCWFRVEFMLTGVPAGTWTVIVEDAPSSSVVVP